MATDSDQTEIQINIKNTLLRVWNQKMPSARLQEVLNLAPHNATLITSYSYLCFQLHSN